MNISLPPELMKFVQRKAKSGFYKGPDEVVCAALRVFCSIESPAAGVFSAAGLCGMDVGEAAFMVLMQATKGIDEDLKMIMAEIEALTAAKQRMRELIRELNEWISAEMGAFAAKNDSSDINDATVTGTRGRKVYHQLKMPIPDPEVKGGVRFVKIDLPKGKAERVAKLKSMREELKAKLDGMNEMSEMISLRLQMTMDRRSKFIETLSNVMRKISTTQETLVQNLK